MESSKNGGESGIRTHDTIARIHTFQACALAYSSRVSTEFLEKPSIIILFILDSNCKQITPTTHRRQGTYVPWGGGRGSYIVVIKNNEKQM